LGKLLAKRIQAGQETLVLGGGHETAWGHYQGLAEAWPGRIGIINFDAHFDLREPMHGKGSSGTPFFQIAHSCRSSGRDFDYCCLGIQPSGNARILFKRARDLGVEAILASDLKWGQQGQLMQRIERFIEAVDAVYLSIDLDVFSEAHAPGVSAPQALGLDPWDLLPYLDRIAERAPKASLDIVELNPSSDQDEQTARLGAQLAHRWLLKRARALSKS
jgi:formiminoglutamase